MKRMKLPLVTACALVLAGNVSFAAGTSGASTGTSTSGGSYDASKNTDQPSSSSGMSTGSDSMSDSSSEDVNSDTTSSTTTDSTSGSMTAPSTDTTSGTSTDMSSGSTSGTTTTQPSTTTGTSSGMGTSTEKSDKSSMMKKGQNYQVINFTGKTATLSDAQKREIRTLVDAAKQKGEIDQVHVAVWSDKAFPKEGQNLTDAERNLAEQRISAIEKYMNDQLQVSNVETYSMAERTNWFARAFNTNEAELQSLFSQQGAPQNVDPQEFKIVKKEGGMNKAVILIEMKDPASGSQSSSTMSTDPSSSSSDRAPASTTDDMSTEDSGSAQ